MTRPLSMQVEDLERDRHELSVLVLALVKRFGHNDRIQMEPKDLHEVDRDSLQIWRTDAPDVRIIVKREPR